jgi:hypothetical protein
MSMFSVPNIDKEYREYKYIELTNHLKGMLTKSDPSLPPYFTAGSYALREALFKNNRKVDWEPNDVDIFVITSDIDTFDRTVDTILFGYPAKVIKRYLYSYSSETFIVTRIDRDLINSPAEKFVEDDALSEAFCEKICATSTFDVEGIKQKIQFVCFDVKVGSYPRKDPRKLGLEGFFEISDMPCKVCVEYLYKPEVIYVVCVFLYERDNKILGMNNLSRDLLKVLLNLIGPLKSTLIQSERFIEYLNTGRISRGEICKARIQKYEKRGFRFF